MYRRPKFLEILDEVRQQMSREADYDVDLFAEMIRSGKGSRENKKRNEEEILSLKLDTQENLSTQIKR